MTRTSKALLLGIGRLTNIGLSLALAASLSRLLPRTLYGSFRQVLDIYGVLIFLVAGLPDSIYFYFPRYEGRDRRIFMSQTLALMAVQGGVLTLALYYGADVLGTFYKSPALPDLLRAFAPYAFFMVPFLAIESTLMSVDRPLASMLLSVAARTISFLAMVVPTWLGAPLETGLHWWVASAAVLACVAVAIMLRAAGGPALAFSSRIARAQLRFSSPILLATGFAIITLYVDKIVVSHSFGPAIYASYANGAMELPFGAIVAGSINTVIYPEMVRLVQAGRLQDLVHLFHRATRSSSVMLIPIMGLAMFLAPEIMTVLYSQAFVSSATFFRVYLLLVPMRVAMYAQLAFSLQATWIYTRAAVLAATAATVLCSAGVAVAGAPEWAAAGSVVAIWAGFIYAAHQLSRRMGILLTQFLPLRHWVGTTLVSLACGVVASAATLPLRGSDWTHCAIRLGVASILFTALYATTSARLGLARWREIWRALRPAGGNQDSARKVYSSPFSDT